MFLPQGESPSSLSELSPNCLGNCNLLSYTPATKIPGASQTEVIKITPQILIPKNSRIRTLKLYPWLKGIMLSFIYFQIREIKLEVWGKHSSISAGSFLLSFLWPPTQSTLDR